MKQTPKRKMSRRLVRLEDAHRRDLARLKREMLNAMRHITAGEVVFGDPDGHELRVWLPKGSEVDISRLKFPCGYELKMNEPDG